MDGMTFEQRIKTAREAAGLSQVDVEFQSRIELPEPLWITQAKLSRLERGSIGEDKADPLDICFLAHLYNVTTSDLSVVAAGRLERVRDLVAGNAWSPLPV